MAHRPGLFPLMLGLIFLLFGCAEVGPNFRQPAASVSSNWLDADDPRVKTGVVETKNWWQAFNDPALNRLMDHTFQENLPLRIAGLRVLEARAQLGIAVGGLYPQSQQAFGSLQYNRLSAGSPTGPPSGNFNFWQSEIGLMAGWEVDFWGKFRRAIESADAGLGAAVADYDDVLVSLTADVANAYILIRTLEKRLDIAVQNVDTQREGLKIAEARFQYGTTSQLDVEQAKTLLNNTLASIPVLKTQLQQAKNALSLLLGLPPGDLSEFLTGPGDIPVSPPEIVVGIPHDLLRRRPDIRRTKLLRYDDVDVEEDAIKKIIMITVVFFIFFLLLGLIGQAFAQLKIEGSNVSYRAGGVEMIGYLAYDTAIKGPRPAVLVVHEWWGLNDYARMRARMLAELGYTAPALDMYGGDRVAAHPEDAQKFSSALMKNFDLAKTRFLAGMDFLKKQPTVDPSRIAAIGYCFGGGIVLNMARQGVDLKGVASFHGNLTAVKPAQPGAVKAKVLVLHGGDDKFSTPEQIEAFKKEMTAAGADFRFITYPGALHSFTNPEADAMGKKFNMPIAYNAQADKQSWDELKKFLKVLFGK